MSIDVVHVIEAGRLCSDHLWLRGAFLSLILIKVHLMSAPLSSFARHRGWIATILVTASLFGCGGGGSSDTPTAPPAQPTGFVAIAAGATHSVAIKADGSLWTWGCSTYGSACDKTTATSQAPTRLDATSDQAYTVVSSGEFHNLALKADGSLWAWGKNENGQLGSGANVDEALPIRVGQALYQQVSAGGAHSAAIDRDGRLWTWGQNTYGQLGDGGVDTTDVPKHIMAGTQFIAVAAGPYHTAAIDAGGNLWTWGGNAYGQLGDGTNLTQPTPQKIDVWDVGLTSLKFRQVAVGTTNTAAITESGDLYVWGWNGYGQVGDGSAADQSTPVKIPGPGYAHVSLNEWHGLAVKQDGSLWAWGSNCCGQIGNEPKSDAAIPVQVGAPGTYRHAVAGRWHSAALDREGGLRVWGDNSYDQLGQSCEQEYCSISVPSGLAF